MPWQQHPQPLQPLGSSRGLLCPQAVCRLLALSPACSHLLPQP